MTPSRTEQDALGTRQIPADALYGIHTQRAIENFPLAMRPVHPGLIHAFGVVKQACLQTVYDTGGWTKAETFAAVIDACKEMRAGKLDAHIRVDALQGGAGTSTNMNVNEVLANRALQRLGYNPGQYDILHPLEDINRWQSTNDTFPTALRVAAIESIKALEKSVILLQEAFEERETAFSGIVKVGRTEMQDAVLTTMGRTMSAFAEAFSRDRWRIYKCEERLRVINLGGTAIGTGLGAPREYIFRVTDVLRSLTGVGLARAENLVEATQNADVFVEVSGILKACAANLLKTASDLRLMSSGPDAGFCELTLPPLQAGSSIMPGKINPVMPEAVSQAALRVMANDQALTSAAALGNLELNAFMPLIADSLLDSLSLLDHACRLLAERCIQGLEANAAQCARHVNTSVATATALVAPLGYQTAEAVLAESRATGLPIGDILEQHGLMNQETFAALITPESVTRLGGPGSTPSAPGGTGSTPSAALHAPPSADETLHSAAGVEPGPPEDLSSAAGVEPGPPGDLSSAATAAEETTVLPVRHHPVHMLPLQQHNQPVILFVTVCTHNREPLLDNHTLHNLLIRAWQQADRWTVGRYLIMPDHVHLFCTPASLDAGNINAWAGYWKGLVARAFTGHGPLTSPGGTGSTPSAEHKTPSKSPLWQRDCWDTQLRDANHYEEKWAYVALNPVRKSFVNAPSEWPYQGELNVLRW